MSSLFYVESLRVFGSVEFEIISSPKARRGEPLDFDTSTCRVALFLLACSFAFCVRTSRRVSVRRERLQVGRVQELGRVVPIEDDAVDVVRLRAPLVVCLSDPRAAHYILACLAYTL